MSVPTNNTRCARCGALDRQLWHDTCLDCVEWVYKLAGQWCNDHGPFPHRSVPVETTFGTVYAFEPQPCPWCAREPAPEWEQVAADAWAKSEQEAA